MRNKNIIAFLESRIIETEKEKEETESIELVRLKGAKITTYKEILHYVKSHPNSTKIVVPKSN